jgi:transcription-repair coupling factor (superfamily II helicase)
VIKLNDVLTQHSHLTLAGAPEGLEALLLAEAARGGAEILHIARDDARLAALEEALGLLAPDIDLLVLPAWDTVPYDRASPHADIVARRLDALSRLAACPHRQGRIVLAPVAAVLQRVIPLKRLKGASFAAHKGGSLDMAVFTGFLATNGFSRTETVMEPGEYAIRGGIIDLFPPGLDEPLRIDLFGDEIERIRAFDPLSQRSSSDIDSFALWPMSEAPLDADSIQRFRTGYRELFGAVSGSDALYESVSAGRRHEGLEHWLPLFHDGLDTLFAYLPEASVTLDYQVGESIDARLSLVNEYYQARCERNASEGGIYNPVPPERLFLDQAEWERHLKARACLTFSPFAPAEGQRDAGGRLGHDFAEVRVTPGADLFAAFADFITAERKAGQRTILTVQGEGARERLSHMLGEHKVAGVVGAAGWDEAVKAPLGSLPVVLWGLEKGFRVQGLTVVAEPDLLGERLSRPVKKRRKAEHFLTEASALSEGDLVVHVDHGIGRYEGLETLTAGGAPHDCLCLVYDGGDKLYVPVENIEVLSRYGADEGVVQLDKLGGSAWQARKAKLKKRIRDMAEQLIAIAAERMVRKGAVFAPPEGLYDEFCSRFPYAETDDQLAAIADVVEDFAKGRPMDRLICGDVGFGKTEVALRAAFVAALSGKQVAVVVPTTLLARQHYRTFAERFKGLPVRVEQLSRLVTAKQSAQNKKDLAEGKVEIIVGTHALLAKSISFKDLGLLIVDEEQHFGVAHKERLKQLRADVHVLTLTATPIPRTLQLALTGVREMSVIATPPVDRLAVRTFVQSHDPVLIREALLREHFRGGQSFYVCPRVADIDKLVGELRTLVPELKLAVAHGQLAPTAIEEVMTRFGDGEQDILLATNIIESGLDMPRVNTLIIHRADMFGLAQLYQLRGRVGRSKQRGYAYLTLPAGRMLTKSATKRLEVMQALDTLGAGFTLASHDLDIRGAGNLLGDEQSGHIKEVGIELYQHLLEEAVAAAKGHDVAEEQWSPQIGVGQPVLIPETYVADLSLRLSLYRRIADVKERAEIDELAFELADRFGKLPEEVENLLNIVAIKIACRSANIEKLEAGPKGALIAFRNNQFPNPAGLVELISRMVGTVKLRPDHKLVVMRAWEEPSARIKGAEKIALELASLAKEVE